MRWPGLRSLFARVGSDPYYANYERSLSNIKAEVDRLQAGRAARRKAWAAVRARFLAGFASVYAVVLAYAAWVNRQPHGTYTPAQQAARVAPVFLSPLAGWLAHRLLGWLQGALDRRSAARVKLLEGKLRKQVSELKDSTRYERTLALLQKFDPDYAPPVARTPSGRQLRAGAAGGSVPAPVSRAAGAAVNAAGSALQGAGARMLPALAQLYSRAAGTLIADDPVMLGLLREAQQQADVARHRLVEAEGRAVALLRENIALKQQLGLPTEEEIAALTAWTCSGSGLGTPAAAQQVQQQAALPAAEEGEGEEAGAPAAAGAPPADGPADEGEEEAGEEEVMAAADPPSSAGGSASRRRRGSQRA